VVKNYVEAALETLVYKATRVIGRQDVNYVESFRLAHMLAAIAPQVANKISRLHGATKIAHAMTHKMNVGVRMTQQRFRRKLWLKDPNTELLPKRTRVQQKLMMTMKADDLREQWKAVCACENMGEVPTEVMKSYLIILATLCSSDNCEFYAKNRQRAVSAHIMAPLNNTLKDHTDEELLRLACQVVLLLANEPSLLIEILKSGVVETLREITQMKRDNPDLVLLVLDTLDVIAANAFLGGDVNKHTNPLADALTLTNNAAILAREQETAAAMGLASPTSPQKSSSGLDSMQLESYSVASRLTNGDGGSGVQGSLEERSFPSSCGVGLDTTSLSTVGPPSPSMRHEPISPSMSMGGSTFDMGARGGGHKKRDDDEYGLSSDERYKRRNLRDVVLDTLGETEVLSALVGFLGVPHPAVKLGSLMVLHKLACGHCYYRILDRILHNSGRGLALVTGSLWCRFPTSETMDRATISFFSDLVAQAALALLTQLSSRPEGRDGMITAGAVSLLYPLCEHKNSHTRGSGREFTLALSGLCTLARQDIVKTAAPDTVRFERTPKQTEEALMQSLLIMMSRSPPCPGNSSRRVLKLGILPLIAAFLTKPGSTSFVYECKKTFRYASAIVFDRLTSSYKPTARALCVPNVLGHLSRVLQANKIEQDEGETYTQPVEDIPMFALSVASCCKALAKIALSSPFTEQLLSVEEAERYERVDKGTAVKFNKVGNDTVRTVADMLIHEHTLPDVVALVRLPAIQGPAYPQEMDIVNAAMECLGAIAPQPIGEHDVQAEFHMVRLQKQSVAKATPLLQKLVKESAQPIINILTGKTANTEACSSACYTLARFASTDASARMLMEMRIMHVLSSLIKNPVDFSATKKAAVELSVFFMHENAKGKYEASTDAEAGNIGGHQKPAAAVPLSTPTVRFGNSPSRTSHFTTALL
jgi:hypothetical protein